jgi:hypothetical protein
VALNQRSTARRASSTAAVAADDAGLAECGLPKTLDASHSACSRTCDAAWSPAPV